MEAVLTEVERLIVEELTGRGLTRREAFVLYMVVETEAAEQAFLRYLQTHRDSKMESLLAVAIRESERFPPPEETEPSTPRTEA